MCVCVCVCVCVYVAIWVDVTLWYHNYVLRKQIFIKAGYLLKQILYT